jgi:hypothetical protein
MTLRVYRARTPYSYGPFYDLLVERFPEHRTVQHVFDVPRLGRELGVTGETTHRMFRHDRVHPKKAVKLGFGARGAFSILATTPRSISAILPLAACWPVGFW